MIRRVAISPLSRKFVIHGHGTTQGSLANRRPILGKKMHRGGYLYGGYTTIRHYRLGITGWIKSGAPVGKGSGDYVAISGSSCRWADIHPPKSRGT